MKSSFVSSLTPMIFSRYFQWMLQIPGATSYIGSIGKDKFGEEMKKNSKLAGVNVCLGTFFKLSSGFKLSTMNVYD